MVTKERIPQSRILVLDVCTRWNSTYKILGLALHFRKAGNRIKMRDPGVNDPLDQKDWDKASSAH